MKTFDITMIIIGSVAVIFCIGVMIWGLLIQAEYDWQRMDYDGPIYQEPMDTY